MSTKSDALQQLPGIVGNSPAMSHVCRLAQTVAPSNACVLLIGETGTGKELIAKAIHRLSQRASGPYVRVNCGALHENLLESELFGHVKGSFTGAIENKIGRFEAANGGTVFLDEINSTSPNLQVKLLRVLQEGQFERVGDSRTLQTNVRVIAASNELLEPKMAAGQFREDLFYRLNVVPIFLPPLRARREDIPALTDFFLNKYSAENNWPTVELPPELLAKLQLQDWPGNVRELENMIERLVVFSHDGVVSDSVLTMGRPSFPFRGQVCGDELTELIPKIIRVAVQEEGVEGKLYEHLIGRVERELFQYVLTLYDGVQTKAARMLGINRNTLYKKLEDCRLDDSDPEWMI